jgi:acetolactate synthase-1/3 small subunit
LIEQGTNLIKRPHVERERLLMTLKLNKSVQHEIVELINIFKGKVVDIKQKSITIAVIGTPDKINTTITPFEQYQTRDFLNKKKQQLALLLSKQ